MQDKEDRKLKQHCGRIFRDLRDRRKHLRELRRTGQPLPDATDAPVDPMPGEKTVDGFHAFAWPRVQDSSAQVFQDLWVLYELGLPESGYFVEFGAADGRTFSNSYMLEREMGWSGILSEPFPHFHPKIEKFRKCHFTPKAVYAESGRTLEFSGAERPMFSRLEAPGIDATAAHDIEVTDRFPVETISLDDLLDEFAAPDVIDYISVDTEGTELDILRAFDFSRRHVRAFTVEHNHTSMRDDLHALFTAQGYVRHFPYLSRFDDWYVHQSELGRA